MYKLSGEQAKIIYGLSKEARAPWINLLSRQFQEGVRNIRRYSGSPEGLVEYIFRNPGVGSIPLKAVGPRSWLQRMLFSQRNVLSDQAMRKMVPEAKRFIRKLPGWQGWTGDPSHWKIDADKILKSINKIYSSGGR